MQLYHHQQQLLDEFPARHALVWGTGTGKSRAAIELVRKADVPALFICPKAIKPQWQRYLDDEGFGTSRVLTKEEFRRDWKEVERYEAVVCDECHFFLGTKSQMMKSLKKYFQRHDPTYRWLMSATVFRSSPWDIYVLADLLGSPLSYPKFRDEFFYYVRMGRREIPVVKDGAEEKVARIVNRLGSTVRLDDCIDVPEQTDEVVSFQLNTHQTKATKQLTDPTPVVYYTKKHQIENGVLKGDEYNEGQVFNCDKHDHLDELISEHKKIAIVCRYLDQMTLLQERYNSDRRVYCIHGGVGDRDEIVREVEEADEAIILIQADCAEGYELPSINVVVFASMSFSYVAYTQMRGRFLRINKPTKNLFIHLLTEGGIDEAVYDSVVNKKMNFDLAIYARDGGQQQE